MRFISNPSTGETGIALAQEALARGADVTLILGPTDLEPPGGAHTVRVQTAQEMYEAAMQHAARADFILASAAVSDWRPTHRAAQKEKKSDEDRIVRLVRTPDIIAALAQQKGDAFVVGFAAETQDHEANAREKLSRKRLDAIVVNDVSEGRGFGAQRNALTLLWGSNGKRDLGEGEKTELAGKLLEALQELTAQRVTGD